MSELISRQKLKPCPFCGGEAVISVDTDAITDTEGRVWAYTAVCNKCAASSGLTFTVEKAIEVWNKRVDQPPADQWIPCSERLPKEDGEYLVWYDCGDDETGCMVANFYEEEGAFGYWHNHYDYDTLGYVDSEFVEMETSIAWMPLPEPYKGGMTK